MLTGQRMGRTAWGENTDKGPGVLPPASAPLLGHDTLPGVLPLQPLHGQPTGNRLFTNLSMSHLSVNSLLNYPEDQKPDGKKENDIDFRD